MHWFTGRSPYLFPKRLISGLFLTTLMLVFTWQWFIPARGQTLSFDERNHWASACITGLQEFGIVNGYPDGRFRPDAPVTRAEFAVMVDAFTQVLPRQRPGVTFAALRPAIQFRDVPRNHWAYRAVQNAYQMGFLSGYPGNQFQPQQAIPRVQALGAIAGGMGYPNRQPVDPLLRSAFTDAKAIPSYARGAIAAGLENRLVVAYPNPQQLSPNRAATRGEIAAFFCQILLPNTIPNQYIASVATAPPQNSNGSGEIRGVWLTNIDSEVLFDRDGLPQAIADLAQLGFNSLYPTVWNWGYTLYPSRVARNVTGFDRDPRPEAKGLRGRDMLAEMVSAGHRHQQAVIPWFEFGFMAPANSELAQRRPQWLTQRPDSTTVWMEGIYPRVWLNPFHPEVQQFIQDLVLEIVTRYDVDGIQLDDHFGLPNDFGYDPYTLNLYQQENPGQPRPAPTDPNWVRWRANKITGFMRQLFTAIKAQKRQVLVALSPNPYEFAYNAHLQDWLTWEREGLIEELIVQIYRSDRQRFIEELAQPSLRDALTHIPTAVGILTGLKDRPVPFRQVQDQVQLVRDRGYSGVSFFFYETLWNLTNEPKAQRRAALQSLFAAPTRRPTILPEKM